MALTQSDKKEIEVLIRKEIKDFFNSSTSKQFENKLMDKIHDDLKKGKLRGEVKEVILKSFQEYFTVMYQQRGFWEQNLGYNGKRIINLNIAFSKENVPVENKYKIIKNINKYEMEEQDKNKSKLPEIF
jgi:hypothetical protein